MESSPILDWFGPTGFTSTVFIIIVRSIKSRNKEPVRMKSLFCLFGIVIFLSLVMINCLQPACRLSVNVLERTRNQMSQLAKDPDTFRNNSLFKRVLNQLVQFAAFNQENNLDHKKQEKQNRCIWLTGSSEDNNRKGLQENRAVSHNARSFFI